MSGRTLILLVALLINHPLLSQFLYRETNQLQVFRVSALSDGEVFTLSPNQPISAVAIRSNSEAMFELEVKNTFIKVPLDHDAPDFTYFVSLSSSPSSLKLRSHGTSQFEVYLIESGEAPSTHNQSRLEQVESCADTPVSIPQSEWRSGLPAPSYTRVFHEVFHHVVHHAAGSNLNSNYTQVVRDIYIYHTQVNGWSDIGYNYLIAQDGTIYAGRDPDGGSQDQVRGAHFCGANTGTLGICLLGNYETANPTAPALHSLKSLLTYGLLNQSMSPFETYSHSLGRLGTVIGHRAGCATLCPGENVYNMLEELKVDVIQEMEVCGAVAPIGIRLDTPLAKIDEAVNFQAVGGYQEFHWVFEGGVPETFSGESASIKYPIPGFYDVTLIGQRGVSSDTLLYEDLIKASYLFDKPFVYPNFVTEGEILRVDSGEHIEQLTLHDIHGRLIGSSENESYNLSGLMSGMYILLVETASNVYKEKLLIR